MTIKVHPDGSIEVTTIDEALELQRRIGGGQEKLSLRSKTNGQAPSYDDEVFTKLKPYDGREIDSETMKDIIDAQTTGGVGPKLYHMKNRIPGLTEVLRERKDDTGHTFWRVEFP